MILVRVKGLDPFQFRGFGAADWFFEHGILYITQMLPNPKKVEKEDGTTVTVDRVAVAAFGVENLLVMQVIPEEAEKPLISPATLVPPHLAGVKGGGGGKFS